MPAVPQSHQPPCILPFPGSTADTSATARPRATVCILTYGDYRVYFQRCLESVLAHTPLEQVELRLGFNQAPLSFAQAVGRLIPDQGSPERALLPGQVERLGWQASWGRAVTLWQSPVNLYKEPMARLLFYDRPLGSDYVVWLDDDSYVEAGWWEALTPLFDAEVAYIGQPWWVYYLPGQAEMIQAQSWYRGVPFALKEGRPGVTFMTGGFLAVKTARLQEADFPDTSLLWKGDSLRQYGGDTLLGEIARQLGWTQARHDQHIRVNVDLLGRHPAPRRGGIGRQFGSDLDVAIA